MNRKERRKLGVTSKPETTYSYTYAQLEEMRTNIRNQAQEEANKQLVELIKRAKKEASDEAIKRLFCIPAVVLHDKYGFGRIRLDRFMGYVQTWIKAIDADPDTLDELLDVACKESGYGLVLDGVFINDKGKTQSIPSP